MACLEAPGLVIEKRRLIVDIGGIFLGIVGDQEHDYGYHLCVPAGPDDYSGQGAANKAVGNFSCAIDIGMDWPAAVAWLHWLIKEIREDRIQGIAEVIGSYDGKNVRYWSDDDGWEDAGIKYSGSGHDRWTHVSVYRSTAHQDHGILKGWSANGNNAARGVAMELTTKLDQYRDVGTALREIHAATHSALNDSKTGVAVRVARIDEAVAKLSTGNVDLAALAALLKPIITEAVRAELAKLTLKAAP